MGSASVGSFGTPLRVSALRLLIAAFNLEERVRFIQSSLAVAREILIGQAEAADKGHKQLTKVYSCCLHEERQSKV